MAGGVAVFVGAFLPLASNVSASGYAVFGVNSHARESTIVFGVVLAALAVAVQYGAARGRFRKPAITGLAITLLVLAGLGTLGYGVFAVAGLAGFQDQTDLLGTVTVTYSPGIGLILILIGCLATAAGAIRILAGTGPRRQAPTARAGQFPDAAGQRALPRKGWGVS